MNHHSSILTPLELKVMQILWKLERAFVKDIIDNWTDEPKPAYNTVSTIVRLLESEEKNFVVAHNAYGRTHEYYPTISREEYQKKFLQNTIDKVFGGSVKSLLSTLVDDEKVSSQELEALKKLLDGK